MSGPHSPAHPEPVEGREREVIKVRHMSATGERDEREVCR
jgi:hypothetical protein